MLRFTILGSGSSGNCALVESGETRLLIDAGFSARQIARRLQPMGLGLKDLHGILLTHEHSDHTAGLRVLCGSHQLPLYCNRPTADCLRHALPKFDQWRLFVTGDRLSVGDLVVETFPIPHDASDPVGFVVEHGTARLGLLTDLGHATELVIERVRNCQTLLLEANHDLALLQSNSRRPWSVKQRILSRHGHLSNEGAAGLVRRVIHENLSHLFLGHLSADCNTPALALGAIGAVIDELGFRDRIHLSAASQDRPTERVVVGSAAT
ncbi:MAG TPA: MBL fold metallo-hydrolase [Verrucomicrobiae bacterium]|nr:MBL fold metallo-hydrolase [Verrucomicrobiae bacterium]